ncbi:hypothetical protein Spla01_01394 [Streptomyces platensis]|uniref:Uncharacterized protein n=1 Tax=Streptomyces platensis TaxID=58346 RepID=A0ABX3Y577_STRPT|nr:hypothetical protein BG653_00671 [Streptomyces platensis]
MAGNDVDMSFLLEEEGGVAWDEADLPLRRNLLRLAIDELRVIRLPGAEEVQQR